MPTIRRKRNPIWFIPLDQLRATIATATSLAEVLRHFGLAAEGYNHGILKARIQRDNLDISHIQLGRTHNKGRTFSKTSALSKERALTEVFTEHGKWSRNAVKAYLRRYDLIPYQCKCGLKGYWEGQTLSLQIDHINGREDHRLANLRWLCPNCHSQTPNFSGKANKRNSLRPSEIDPTGWRNCPHPKARKFPRPSKEELQLLVWQKPMAVIARELGAGGGNVIKKWCLSMDVTFPSRGYWRRRELGRSHDEALNPPPRRPKQPLPMTALTQEQASEVRQCITEGISQRTLAKRFGCNRNTIQAVLASSTYGSRWGREKHPSIAA